jgi:hypothetical protein
MAVPMMQMMVLLVIVAVLSPAAAAGAVTAIQLADSNPQLSHRSLQQALQQARPRAMNMPILAADDMERGSTPQSQDGKPQQQKQKQQRSSGRPDYFGRKLQQGRGWGSHLQAGQQWPSQPIPGYGNSFNWGQNPGAGRANAASQAAAAWDNRGIVGGTAAADSQTGGFNGRRANPGAGRGNAWGNNKGDRASLQALTGDTNSWSSITAQPITAMGAAATLSQGIRRRGNAQAAAQSLAQAYSSGQADAAAQAVASAATVDSDAEATATAEAVAEATVSHPNVAPGLLAKSAGLAVSRGQTDKYARTMADAFAYSKRRNNIPQFTSAVADAIATGGASTRYAYGQAIATAIADGGDSQAAVAEATATALCQGGSTATAWSQAYAVALSQNSHGCLVLNQAKAMAQAKCGAQGAQALSNAEATSTVLGFCGLLNMLPSGMNYNWAGGSSGSSSNGAWSGR